MTDPLTHSLMFKGVPIETPWPKLDRVVKLRPGILMNLYSAPGQGKSMFMLNLLLRSPGLRSVYVTPDTPVDTLRERTWSVILGKPMDSVPAKSWVGNGVAKEMDRRGVMFDWYDRGSYPDLEQVEETVLAFRALHGIGPQVLAVDVISDLLPEKSFEGLSRAWHTLGAIAGRHKLLVIGLHHTRKGVLGWPKLSDVEYSGGQQPDVAIALVHKERKRQLTALVRKNRHGKQDVTLHFKTEYERGLVV